MEQIITTTTTITERCTLHKLSCPSWPTLPMVHSCVVVVGYCTVVVLGVSQINHWELYLLILHERPVALSPPQAMTRKILKVKVKVLRCGLHT